MTLDQVMKVWAMDRVTPTIKPVLNRTIHRDWAVTLEEVWPDDNYEAGGGSGLLDKRVDWCVEELKKWQGVRRMAWDQWYFDDRHQAEKFITLYSLIWAK